MRRPAEVVAAMIHFGTTLLETRLVEEAEAVAALAVQPVTGVTTVAVGAVVAAAGAKLLLQMLIFQHISESSTSITLKSHHRRADA